MAKKSAKTAEKIFHYQDFVDESELRRAFNDYFANLQDINDRPFNCPYLRVLQKSVGIVFNNKPSWRYEIFDLICTQGAKNSLSRRCRFGNLQGEERGVGYENGELKFYCPISQIEVIVQPLRTEKI